MRETDVGGPAQNVPTNHVALRGVLPMTSRRRSYFVVVEKGIIETIRVLFPGKKILMSRVQTFDNLLGIWMPSRWDI